MPTVPCSIEGCEKPALARGWCGAHYARWRTHKHPLGGRAPALPPGPCSVADCANERSIRGFCKFHYMRWFKGQPLEGPKRRADHGAPKAFFEAALLDQTGDCILWPYGQTSSGYARYYIDGKPLLAHRVALERMIGPPPEPGMFACHTPIVCHTRHCIQWRHLRWGTAEDNGRDMTIDDTSTRGERSVRARLTEADILAIRASGAPDDVLGVKYDVSTNHIWKIRNYKRWRHVA